MANENRVQIIITTDSTGAVTGIRGVEEETKRSVSEMEKYWLRLGTAIAAAFSVYKAADIIRDSTMIASRVETLGVVMEAVGKNAGYSKAEVEAYSESVKQMGITTQASHQTVIRMMQAQMDLNQASQLARVAQDAAVIGNINSSEALERMIQGIQRGETEIMKTIGLNVNFENSYKTLAAQLGKNTDQLTEAERVQARTNVTLEAGTRIAGTYEAAMETAGKQLLSLPRYIEEAQRKFGELFTPAMSVLIVEITENLKKLNAELDTMKKAGDLDAWSDKLAEGMREVIAEAYRLAMLLDKIGGTLTTIGTIGTLGLNERMIELNTMFRQRYEASDRALMDMAMRQEGFRPASQTELMYGAGDLQKIITESGQVLYYIKQLKAEVSSVPAAVGTAAGKSAAEIKKLTESFDAWAVQIENLNPLLSSEEKQLAEINRRADEFIAKGMARATVEQARALAEQYINQKQIIKAEEELADWQKDMYRMAEEELAYFTAMQGTELEKQIAQIDAAAAKIGANLGMLGLDAEEFETRWAEIARVSEIVKQTARDESHKKILQQLKEQGEQYQALFDQVRQYQTSNYNDIWSSLSGTAGQSGDYATGANMILSSMRGITDVMTGRDKYTLEYERARDHYNQMRELYQQHVNDYGGSEAAAWELSEAYQQMIIARDQQTSSMRLQTTQSMFGTMAGLAQAFYTAGGKQSQAAFNLYKAFAIAEATIAGYKATINAYEFGTKYGGPVVGAIMAATAAATTAMYIASIASQTMSSIATPTVTSSGGTSSISTTATQTTTTEKKAETRPLVVNFYNYGFMTDEIKDELAREFVPALQKAVNDGAH